MEVTNVEFGEMLTAMVTPFTEDLEVDYEQAGRLARRLINNGSDGLVVLGTTGEVPTLTEEEKLKLLEVVIEEVGEETTIIAGTGCYSTQSSIELTKKAEAVGVDGVMLVTPYYNKPPQVGLYNHFKLVAEETDLPILLYNVPSRTGRNLAPATIERLAEIDNIKAVKEASGDAGQVARINALTNDDFKIYSGDDGMTLAILGVGGTGVVSVAAHLVGDDIKEMIRLYKAGEVEAAARKNAYLNKLFETIFITTNPIPVKKSLNLTGFDVGGLRPPLVELPEELTSELEQVLAEYDLL
jgi:4-hydroxy-tetrahydrodipicolinate synthase